MPTKSQVKTKEETTSTQRLNSPQPQQPETAPAHDVTPAVAFQQSISLLPHVPRSTDMLVLQRAVGNRAIGRLLQAKCKVGPEGDTYEREVQLRMKPAMQCVGGDGAEGFTLDDETAARINRARGSGQPLEGAVQKQMSASLGYDFSGVRVHTGQEADELNRQLRAKAFTTGPDIFFKRGAYDPASSDGRELIAHELTHVVQQSTGRVSGGGSGMTVRPASDAFEQEADAQARRTATDEQARGTQMAGNGIQRQVTHADDDGKTNAYQGPVAKTAKSATGDTPVLQCSNGDGTVQTQPEEREREKTSRWQRGARVAGIAAGSIAAGVALAPLIPLIPAITPLIALAAAATVGGVTVASNVADWFHELAQTKESREKDVQHDSQIAELTRVNREQDEDIVLLSNRLARVSDL